MPAAELTPLLWWLIPVLAFTGLTAGLLAGLLGVGGGIVIVPVLYQVFGFLGIDPQVQMHLAVGTSLATIVATSIRSVIAHHRKQAFDAALFWQWAPAMCIGALTGAWLASLADFATLTMIFAVLAMLIAVHLGIGNHHWQLRNKVPSGPAAALIPATIGGLSAMIGIGGGSFSVATLSLFGVPIHRAVGTSAGYGMVIAVPGTIGFVMAGWSAAGLPQLSTGYVNWLAFVLIVPMTLLAVPIGARLAHSLSQTLLRKVFAIFLAIGAIRMFWDALVL